MSINNIINILNNISIFDKSLLKPPFDVRLCTYRTKTHPLMPELRVCIFFRIARDLRHETACGIASAVRNGAMREVFTAVIRANRRQQTVSGDHDQIRNQRRRRIYDDQERIDRRDSLEWVPATLRSSNTSVRHHRFCVRVSFLQHIEHGRTHFYEND